MGSVIVACNVNVAHQVWHRGQWLRVLYMRRIACRPGAVVICLKAQGRCRYRLEMSALSAVTVRQVRR